MFPAVTNNRSHGVQEEQEDDDGAHRLHDTLIALIIRGEAQASSLGREIPPWRRRGEEEGETGRQEEAGIRPIFLSLALK